MARPLTAGEYLDLVRKSGIVDDHRLATYLAQPEAAQTLPAEPEQLARLLIRDGILTYFQAGQILEGKWRRFSIGRYKVLERLGSGSKAMVYLCEDTATRRLVAVKVLPTASASQPALLERFKEQARTLAALNHPNFVRGHGLHQDQELHFLVMEFVFGSSLHDIVSRHGPLAPSRAVHYLRQAARALQFGHEQAGIIHRNIKPGHLLVDRSGVVKILGLGLALSLRDKDRANGGHSEKIVGTPDFIAPEQTIDSASVDARSDIYSLGCTMYFCLTGQTPFGPGSVSEKLIWHQIRNPTPLRQRRPEIPAELATLIERMMAKEPGQRVQTAGEIASAISGWTSAPIGPPPESELPRFSPAVLSLIHALPAPVVAKAEN